MVDEELLDVDDIQAHVLAGFGVTGQALLGVKLAPGAVDAARPVLARIATRVEGLRSGMRAREERREARRGLRDSVADPGLKLAISLSAEGLRALGAEGAGVPMPEDSVFRQGLHRDARALRDPVDGSGRPVGWTFGDTPDRTPDVLFVLASADPEVLDEGMAELEAELAPLGAVVCRERGYPLAGDAEHFGFRDGVSQPGVRGMVVPGVPFTERLLPPGHPLAELYARPGQPLVWPGQFVLGYQTLTSNTPLLAGAPREPAHRNGSYLVVRRLRQDVAAFQEATTRLAQALSGATGEEWTPERARTACVGRWPNGTPLVLSPGAEVPGIETDRFAMNGFDYAQPWQPVTLPDGVGGTVDWPGAPADVRGHECPFFAHVRKVNPRDQTTELGTAVTTLGLQMLRRGVTYGPPWPGHEDDADRGLLFMSYQSSIESQFRRLMRDWVNQPARPLDGGIDPLIGTPPAADALRRLKLSRPQGGQVTVDLPGSWVVPSGGGYFFTPGLAELARIIGG